MHHRIAEGRHSRDRDAYTCVQSELERSQGKLSGQGRGYDILFRQGTCRGHVHKSQSEGAAHGGVDTICIARLHQYRINVIQQSPIIVSAALAFRGWPCTVHVATLGSLAAMVTVHCRHALLSGRLLCNGCDDCNQW